MDAPYRSAPRGGDAGPPRDAGIVGDVVAQFADTLAFYRELVQNAIDAGSPEIEVELRFDAEAGAVRALVRDRGEGMDQDVLENQLLVLFRSTKDRDPTKIGKFGIGFSSVLAPRPRLVVIQTVRGGRRLTVHLTTDLAYRIFDGGRATRDGTTVELELPMAADAVADFARQSRDALARWCRHATVPIRFTARGPGGEPLEDVRIDRPLGLDGALVEVRGVSSDGQASAVVGLMPGAAPYAGFFNRGLMLREGPEALAGQVAFKVQDPRLGHTLSRDDVRRDAAFERALGLVRELAGQALCRAAAAELATAAQGDGARWRALFEALDAAELPLRPEEWVAPLRVPVGDDTAVAPARVPYAEVWASPVTSPLVTALAEGGIPVVALTAGGIAPELLRTRVARSCRRMLVEASAALTLVTEVPPTVADHGWLGTLGELLTAVARRPRAIVLAELDGARADVLTTAGGCDAARHVLDERRWVIDGAATRRNPLGWLWRPTLLVNARHPLVVGARRRAAHDPVGAASLVARAVLQRHGKLDDDASEELLTATLDRLGGAP